MMFMIFSFFLIVSASEDQQKLKVKPGADVPLQCRAAKHASIILLEWNRSDLRSDGYVFFFRENRSYKSNQLSSFRGRVELRDPETKDGDASVILKNVTADDTGTYECRLIISNSGDNETTHVEIKHLIDLTVTDSDDTAGDKDGGNEDGDLGVIVGSVIGGLLLLVIVCIGCMIYRTRKGLKEQNSVSKICGRYPHTNRADMAGDGVV